MTPPPPSSVPDSALTREQLYARIRASSKQEVVLEEMQRLGFWPRDTAQPTVEAQLIRREGELQTALSELGNELRGIEDRETALKAMRKERMARARERREETRQRLAQQRHARALDWHARRQRELLYLGEGVSGGLNEARSDEQSLARHALPALHDATDLARSMGLELGELRFLAWHREVARVSHYQRFTVPKKTGGERRISAPMPRLKRAQYWVLDNVLAKVPVHEAVHGFLPGRSILSNAAPHVGQAVVVNLDLQDFFPSIGLRRVRGVFRQLGYSPQVATPVRAARDRGADRRGRARRRALLRRARRARAAAGRAHQPDAHQPAVPPARRAAGRLRRQAGLSLHALCRRPELLGRCRAWPRCRQAAVARPSRSWPARASWCIPRNSR